MQACKHVSVPAVILRPRLPLRRHELLDCTQDINDAAAAIVDDTFTKCFKSNEPDPWNWNAYLFPLWCCGCAIRYGILFPIRYRFFVTTHLSLA